MEIVRILLLFSSLVIRLKARETSINVDGKNLVDHYVKRLESELIASVSIATGNCMEETIRPQISRVNSALSDFEDALTDCIITNQTYTGRRNYTASGKDCMNWLVKNPHDHIYVDKDFPDGSIEKAQNYCRNPDGSGIPWCYTTDYRARYEDCGVPRCDEI